MTKPVSKESRLRVSLSRALSIAAVLLLYWAPDTVAFVILGIGILIYYVPTTAAAPCEPPKWFRATWFIAGLIVCGVYFTTNIEPPKGSIVPPVLGYGALLLLAVQILWDVVRNQILANAARESPKSEQGAYGEADQSV